MAFPIPTMPAGSPVFSPSRIGLGTEHDGSAPFMSCSSPPSLPGPAFSPSTSSFVARLQKEGTGMLKVHSSSSSSSPATSTTTTTRKRPARIDVPQKGSMWGGDEKRGVARGVDAVEVDRTRFSVFCKRGKAREVMEDRYSAGVDIGGDSRVALFGIFDGHGGAKAADFVAKNIKRNVMGELSKTDGNEVVEAVKRGYLSTDSDLLNEDVKGGTCSVTALIRNDDLIVSNAGDCRAVMSRGGHAEALTSDHRPCREDEKNRIECLGGYVDCFRGTWRLQGSLAVSRGMGDAHLKRWVIAEPETKVLKIDPDCEFLILASDGLWDKVSNQEAVDIARPLCLDHPAEPSVLSACKVLVELSVSRGSLDDVSVMIIPLKRIV